MARKEPEPPSMNDILTAVAALRPAPVEEKGLAKHVGTIIVALLLALCLWVGATLVSVGNTLTKVSTSVDNIQKSVDELKLAQNGMNDKIADLQSRLAQHDQRLNSIDGIDTRLAERLRIVEGQKPLSAGASQ